MHPSLTYAMLVDSKRVLLDLDQPNQLISPAVLDSYATERIYDMNQTGKACSFIILPLKYANQVNKIREPIRERGDEVWEREWQLLPYRLKCGLGVKYETEGDETLDDDDTVGDLTELGNSWAQQPSNSLPWCYFEAETRHHVCSRGSELNHVSNV